MQSSICQFMPEKNGNHLIRPVNFVYETELPRLRQPFFRTVYYLYLVTQGTAVLKINNNTFPLERGTIFIVFPAYLHEINASTDFEFMYISFIGNNVPSMLSELHIDMQNAVYHHFEHLIDFWMDSINRINSANGIMLTESVLLYTLSALVTNQKAASSSKSYNSFCDIISFVENNFRDPDISLSTLATHFSYSEKYISQIFKESTGVGFRRYLNMLRIQYAQRLIESGSSYVSEIAYACGFKDSFYFSKVFKAIVGVAPHVFIQQKKERK